MWSQDIDNDLDVQAGELEALAIHDRPDPSMKPKWAHLVTSLVVLALIIGGPITADSTWTCGVNGWSGCR